MSDRDYRDLVVRNCRICKGEGIYAEDVCECIKFFRILVALQEVGFPDYIIEWAYETRLKNWELDIEIVRNRDKFSWVLGDGLDTFLKDGLGLVLYGDGSIEAGIILVASVLRKDYRIKCRYNSSANAVLEVFGIDFERLEEVIKERIKSGRSTIVVLDSLRQIEVREDLADVLGWDGIDFVGGIFRGVEVRRMSKDKWGIREEV